MKLTNRSNAPAPLARLLERDPYSNGGADASVTDLIGSPQINILKRHHADDITQDIADRIWALFGTAVHKMIEAGSDETDHLSEERLFTEVLGWRISGGIDLQHLLSGKVDVWDWKITSVAKVTRSDAVEWEEQLNVYAYLVEKEKGLKPHHLRCCALLRDWTRSESARIKDYPPSPIHVVPLRLWSFKERERFVHERVRLLQQARREFDLDGVLPPCTDAEMWARPASWAILKKGGKRASKVLYSEAQAIQYSERPGDWVIEHRPGERIRCAHHCEVSEFCPQWKAFKGEV